MFQNNCFFRRSTIIIGTIILSAIWSCETQNDLYTQQILNHRRQQFKMFSIPTSSPLPDSAFYNFKGLKYFSVDRNFSVMGIIKPLDSMFISQSISIQDSTGYTADCLVEFTLNNTAHTWVVFKESTGTYFLPFFDASNDSDTYPGGRFLHPKRMADSLWLDFNYAYNPYCAYNHDYICPVPPNQNTTDVFIAAGEKRFYEHTQE